MKPIIKPNIKPTTRIMTLALGSLVCSVAINGFLRPLGLISSGITGLSIILNHISSINIGLIVFTLNIPLFILAYFKLKKEFVIYSLINMIMFSTMLGLTGNVYQYIGVDNVMLSALVGGALNGIGMGITFRGRGSQGGIDIVGAIIRKNWEISIGSALMLIDLAIIATGGYVFGIESFLYTLTALYIGYQFLDKVQATFDSKKSVMIISHKPKEIGTALMQEMNRAITYLKGEGGYTGNEKNIIYTIVNPREIPKIKKIVNEHDPNAFISVFETNEVRGYRFEERFI
ncbi:uncharacterized membrane-anchored protein YitT (DUF2179 family) [Acetoanaerobium pronyense]|uniref:Uncharacterized membrane-anchored protein YitT (DUF2179 family) n=1 Tax=Acetoanaerobium pronyense TaxID=1482736 RepID=A0ABS4KNT7_9FIRM|nr:YitT family protein [Acetoanaerobium pronyense]MBP2028801.1 uncharacterized membrane-anchored protein YitT (DUF2179 family) [Acetoanaerobium pronyense]